MITAIVLATDDVGALISTLGALVPGVAQGLPADAVVVASGRRDEAAAVADALGAVFVMAPGDPWFAAAGVARQDWLLCLEAGDVPGPGWMEAVERFLQGGDGRRLASFVRRPASFTSALTALSEGMLGGSRVRSGSLVRRRCLAEGGLAARMRPLRLDAVIERRGG